jgi:hypothetical protein
MLRAIVAIGSIAFAAMTFSPSAQAQSNSRLAYSCQAECESNVNVCLKYLQACHQPGMGCEDKRAQCADTQACVRTCR